MYQWYQHAKVCIAYLSDIPLVVTEEVNTASEEISEAEITGSRWFEQGWTLQELLAPYNVLFFSRDWQYLGTKNDYCESISRDTRIEVPFLLHERPLEEACIAKRMSWSARRQTTRREDLAYCLMGIFSVNMPLLYGEGGQKAFHRLQAEIMRYTYNECLFAWADPQVLGHWPHGLLADRPSAFAYEEASSMVCYTETGDGAPRTWTMTNRGLRVSLHLSQCRLLHFHKAALSCPCPSRDNSGYVGIYLESCGEGAFFRKSCNHLTFINKDEVGPLEPITVSYSMASVYRGLGIQARLPTHVFRVDCKRDRDLHYTISKKLVYATKPITKILSTTTSANFEITRTPNTLAGAFPVSLDQEQTHICILLGSTRPFEIGFDAKYLYKGDTIKSVAETFCPKPISILQPEKSRIELENHQVFIKVNVQLEALVKVYLVGFVFERRVNEVFANP